MHVLENVLMVFFCVCVNFREYFLFFFPSTSRALYFNPSLAVWQLDGNCLRCGSDISYVKSVYFHCHYFEPYMLKTKCVTFLHSWLYISFCHTLSCVLYFNYPKHFQKWPNQIPTFWLKANVFVSSHVIITSGENISWCVSKWGRKLLNVNKTLKITSSVNWLRHPFHPQVGTYSVTTLFSPSQAGEGSVPRIPGEGLVLLQGRGDDARGGWDSLPLSQMVIQGRVCVVERGEGLVFYIIFFEHLFCHTAMQKPNWISVDLFKSIPGVVTHTATKAFEDLHPRLLEQQQKELLQQKLTCVSFIYQYL